MLRTYRACCELQAAPDILPDCPCWAPSLQHWDDQDIPDLIAWMEEHLQVGGLFQTAEPVPWLLQLPALGSRPSGSDPAPCKLLFLLKPPCCACCGVQEGIATLSSFERYKKELLSGQLTWAPMHDSGALLPISRQMQSIAEQVGLTVDVALLGYEFTLYCLRSQVSILSAVASSPHGTLLTPRMLCEGRAPAS